MENESQQAFFYRTPQTCTVDHTSRRTLYTMAVLTKRKRLHNKAVVLGQRVIGLQEKVRIARRYLEDSEAAFEKACELIHEADGNDNEADGNDNQADDDYNEADDDDEPPAAYGDPQMSCQMS